MNTCKGLRFRAYSNFFRAGSRFEEVRGFRLLKRQSCLGCSECVGLWDFVKDLLSDYDSIPIKNKLDININKDYTVEINDADIEFYPIGKIHND